MTRGSEQTRFLIMFRSREGEQMARTAIESLRTFGGPLATCQVWAFVLDADRVSHALPGMEGIRRLPVAIEDGCPPYPFAEKVWACAAAEEMVGPEIRSLIWLSLDCLVIQPPVLFDLGSAPGAPTADAAFRPVHHQNVGSETHEPLDGYWKSIYEALEIEDMPYTVESFVDGRTLRPYFNTHCFAFDPAAGLAKAWWAHFKAVVLDETFQTGPCRDELHRIFLHQAVLSTLVPKVLDWEKLRLLPPEYNYPLNLLPEMPAHLRARSLNSLVNAVHEGIFPWDQIQVEEPLRSWLVQRVPRENK